MPEKMPAADLPDALRDPPSAWVLQHAARFLRADRILDLACGSGRHVRYLQTQGYKVLAVDRDAVALSALRAMPGVEVLCADLEGDCWPLAGLQFSGIVVTRYLHRPRWPDLAALLAPGGVLIYETFMQGNEAYGSPRRAEFLLRPNELRHLAEAQGLTIIDYREGFEVSPRPAVTQSICCTRPR